MLIVKRSNTNRQPYLLEPLLVKVSNLFQHNVFLFKAVVSRLYSSPLKCSDFLTCRLGCVSSSCFTHSPARFSLVIYYAHHTGVRVSRPHAAHFQPYRGSPERFAGRLVPRHDVVTTWCNVVLHKRYQVGANHVSQWVDHVSIKARLVLCSPFTKWRSATWLDPRTASINLRISPGLQSRREIIVSARVPLWACVGRRFCSRNDEL